MERKTRMKQSSTKPDVHNKKHTAGQPVNTTFQPVVLLEDFMKNHTVDKNSVSELPDSQAQKSDHVQDSCECDLLSPSQPVVMEHKVDQPESVLGDTGDEVDHDLEEVPIKVSSPQEKELKRIARVKQLERMKAVEAATSRQQRYNKRANGTNPIKRSSKKVKWKKDLSVYHIYSDDSS